MKKTKSIFWKNEREKNFLKLHNKVLFELENCKRRIWHLFGEYKFIVDDDKIRK